MTMKRPEASPLTVVEEITAYLDSIGIPYVIIGGLAVGYWGEPRATRDVNISVMVPTDQLDAFFQSATARFASRLPDAIAFARRSRMLLLQTENGIPIDISLAIPGYEEAVMERAHVALFEQGIPVRVISCEDLSIHKCVAGRARDLEDVRTILQRQQNKVDLDYVQSWLAEFKPLVDNHDVVDAFETCLQTAN